MIIYTYYFIFCIILIVYLYIYKNLVDCEERIKKINRKIADLKAEEIYINQLEETYINHLDEMLNNLIKESEERKMEQFNKYVSFQSVEDVHDFVQSVSNINYDIDLLQDRYIVNAKSILGILSLHINKPINLKAYPFQASSSKDYDKLNSLIRKYEI